MKHITPRDIVEFFLFGLGVVLLIILAAVLESTPVGISFWFAAILAVGLWVFWFYLVIRDRKKEALKSVIWVANATHWVAQDGSGRTIPLKKKPEPPVFDQDADAIAHLDINTPKEKA